MSLPLAVVVCTQFLIGFGIVTRLRVLTNGLSLLGLSMLVGLGVSSITPFVVQFAQLPIAPLPILSILVVLALGSLWLLRGQWTYLSAIFEWKRVSIRLYELPFLGFWTYLLVISAWKCAWFPNTPFDTIVGPDLVATFAVRERTLVSSVFTEHLPLVSVFSNQPFYAPFTAMQQIIYRLAAQDSGLFMFGKLWLTSLVISFGLFLYAELRERIHPILAGILVTMLACTPELFAYTFLVQTDWANAAFVASGVILLQRYLESNRWNMLITSGLLLEFACWTRSETIFFVPIGSVVVLLTEWKSNRLRAVGWAAMFSLLCLIPVLFWNYGFLRGYVALPAHVNVGQIHGISENYFDELSAVFAGMNKRVVFHAAYWNYAVPVFLVTTCLNLVLFRDRHGLVVLAWITGVYLIFGFIIQHVDGANIAYTFRRGFFKLLFLMYFYLGTTTLLRWMSVWLYRWEARTNSTTAGIEQTS
ncbi:glycosyltransferase family 39 protein [Spirosoma aureum]|uniref:Glycosyltransferase family 39 protein n=1 Tax=Spirosoma aureum TaxID=2692134 RepID=A0A6G9AQ69_9BACT|nr:glycosyltransferase family 39 protein [Spirosoma aureum]QIP14486.1 glycosyltransferase family 39 protein [Spirosoma aureum]